MWTKVTLVFTLCAFLVLSFAGPTAQVDMYHSTVPQLLTAEGYPNEKYRAKTEDGYILQLHRIPAGKRTPRKTGPSVKGKKAVLLVHGLVGSSGDFVIMGPERSLAYILADAGYDVWLGNLRGNIYTAHENLTKADPRFWEFSFHEHGKYDLPAMIERVLSITGLKKVMYIGYSMGTTSFFVMMSLKPEYNSKVIAFTALAPAVYLDQIRDLANVLLRNDLPNAMRARGVMTTSPQPEMMVYLSKTFCSARKPSQDICLRFAYSIVGEDYEQNDWNMSPIIFGRFQPATWRQLEHFGKIAISGVFTQYEDGVFGKIVPYNLTNVKVPVTLLYGENDQLTEKSQILRLAAELNKTGVLEDARPACSWPKFNHLDFVFAKDLGTLLTKSLIKHIDNQFNKYGLS